MPTHDPVAGRLVGAFGECFDELGRLRGNRCLADSLNGGRPRAITDIFGNGVGKQGDILGDERDPLADGIHAGLPQWHAVQ